jgi:hypothetical protein
VVHDPRLAQACDALHREVQLALERYGKADHPAFGKIWAYEVDGYGSLLMMDDANVPSLLSLPYIGSCPLNDSLYQRTRQFVLSNANPYYVAGRAAAGLGSPHAGRSSIWPMGIILQAMTSSDDGEIVRCVRLLRDTTAGTGFMHESFDEDNALRYTRRVNSRDCGAKARPAGRNPLIPGTAPANPRKHPVPQRLNPSVRGQMLMRHPAVLDQNAGIDGRYFGHIYVSGAAETVLSFCLPRRIHTADRILKGWT